MTTGEQHTLFRSTMAVEGGNPVTANHDKLLDMLKRLKKEGMDAVDSRKADMQKADKMYRLYRPPDEDDKKAKEKGQPIKIVYPVTFAQIQATLAILLSTFIKKPFFELEGRSPNFYRGSKLFELELQYELEQASFFMYFHQMLLDMLKYGFAKMNVGYKREFSYQTVPNPVRSQLNQYLPFMAGFVPEKVTQRILGYEGAEFTVDDPYEVCFDPRVSIGEIQKGRFIFQQEKMSYNTLRSLADEGTYFNIENLPKHHTGLQQLKVPSTDFLGSVIEGSEEITIDTAFVRIVPKNYGLGELEREQIWRIAMANEARIIAGEPSPYQHNKFPCVVAEYLPDLHNTTNDGMSQTIDGLQNLIDWLLNSHMDSVRKTINNHWLIDPDKIYIEDVKAHKNVWRTKPGALAAGADRIVKQFNITDYTQQNLNDANMALSFVFRTSGVNDNTMGLQLPTGRTATEVATLSKSSAGRLRMLALSLFFQTVRPLGEQMIQNVQSQMEAERFIKVTGDLARQMGIPAELIQEQYVRIDPSALQGSYSISMIDPNTPTDKMFLGNILKDVLVGVTQNPQFAAVAGVNPSALVNTMLMMFGVPNISDIVAPVDSAEMKAMLAQVQGIAGRGVQATVMDPNQIQQQVQAGNLI